MSQVNILVVEDSAVLAQNIVALLEDQAFNVVSVAMSGTEAIQCALTTNPDLILMDVTLQGGVDGIETAVKIREQIDIPIVYSTGSTDYKTINRAKHTEPHGFLVKPFTDIELYTAIEMALYKHKMDRQLKESETRLANILDTAADAIITIDSHYAIDSFNRGAEYIFGYKAEEIIGKPLEILLPTEKGEAYRQYPLNFEMSPNSGQPIESQHLAVLGKRKNGESIPVDISVSTFEQNGEIFFTTILRDITDRVASEEALRQSEQKNRSLLDAIPDMMFRVHRNGTLLDYKSPGDDNLLYTPPETFLGKKIDQVIPTSIAQLAQHHIQQALDTNEIQLYEYDLPIQDNMCSFEARAVVSGKDEVLVIVRDITQRKRALETIQQSEEKLSAIYQLGRDLTLIRQESVIAEQVLSMASDLLQTQVGSIALCQQEKDELIYRYRQTNGEIKVADTRFSLLEDKSIGTAVVKNHQPLNIPDTTKDSRYLSKNGAQNQSVLCIPMNSGEQIIGVFEVEHEKANYFKEADVQLLQVLADYTAVALKNAQLQEDALQRERELTALNKASYALASSLHLDTVLDQLMIEIRSLFGAEAASVLLLDPEQNELVFSAVASPKSETLIGMRIDISQGVAGYVIREGHPIMVAGAQHDPRFYNEIDKASGMTTNTILAAPLITKGTVTGVVEVINETGGLFNEHSLGVLASLANSAAISIENARLFTETKRNARDLALINKAGRALVSSLDLDTVLNQIMVEVKTILKAEVASIILKDTEKDYLYFAAVASEESIPLMGTRLLPDKGIAGWVLREQTPLLMLDVQSDPRFHPSIDGATGVTTRSLLAVPLIFNDASLGVIEVLSSTTNTFKQHDLELLAALATSAAIAIINARSYESERQAYHVSETLRAANFALTQTLDLKQILNNLLDYLNHLVSFDSGNVMLFLDDSHLIVRAEAGYKQWSKNRQTICEQIYDLDVTQNLQDLIKMKKSLIISDTHEYESWIATPGAEHVRSWMGIPLIAGGTIIGLYSLDKVEPNYFTDEHRLLAESLAAQAAVAIQNALLRRAEQEQYRQLQLSQAQLVQMEKMGALGRLIASIAHEINNPLQAVQGCLTLTKEELNSNNRAEKVELYLDIVEQEIERISIILQRMRDFYRPARSQIKQIDINDILQSVLELSNKQLQQSNITIDVDLEMSVPPIESNPDHLKQVFLNLLLNAVDAMPDGGHLQIMTATSHMQKPDTLEKQNAICIQFKDNGVGMSEETLAHLFEPFFTNKETGTGLGLSVSYGLIEAMNGQILADSKIDVGTTFNILLPV